MILCVTGTGTDVGKTVATAAVASVYRQRGWDVVVAKPLQTGVAPGAGDADAVARLAGVPTTTGWYFPEPLAPNLAARRAGLTPPTLGELAQWVRRLDAPGRMVLVEGAGGLLVRFADDYTLADLAAEVEAPLLVVTTLGLGSLNVAELTVEAAERRGLSVAGLIGGSLPRQPDLATRLNVDELAVVAGVELFGCLPERAGTLEAEEFAAMSARELARLPW